MTYLDFEGRLELLQKTKALLSDVSMSLLGTEFKLRIEQDLEIDAGRIFIQIIFNAPCAETGKIEEQHGRKFYLSRHMLDDEIIKTAYLAFETCVKHEVMEGFKVKGITLFNPHVHYTQLLTLSANPQAKTHRE